MGYNFVVTCRCFERGLTKVPPIPRELIERDPTEGYLRRIAGHADEAGDLIFDAWSYSSCHHEAGWLCNEHLGNIATVGNFRQKLLSAGLKDSAVLKLFSLDTLPNHYEPDQLVQIEYELREFRISSSFSDDCSYTADALNRGLNVALSNQLPAYIS